MKINSYLYFLDQQKQAGAVVRKKGVLVGSLLVCRFDQA